MPENLSGLSRADWTISWGFRSIGSCRKHLQGWWPSMMAIFFSGVCMILQCCHKIKSCRLCCFWSFYAELKCEEVDGPIRALERQTSYMNNQVLWVITWSFLILSCYSTQFVEADFQLLQPDFKFLWIDFPTRANILDLSGVLPQKPHMWEKVGFSKCNESI
jgi:hypothetical protein